MEKREREKKQSWKKKKKWGKVGKKMKKYKKKKRGKNTVDYCCNPHWFGCGGTVIPPHHLDIVNNDTKQDKIILRN